MKDFKTGPIWTLNDGYKKHISKSYKVQLLTYGYVFWEKGFDASSITCGLTSLNRNDDFEIKFSDEEYSKHKCFLQELKAEINQFVKENRIDELGSPNNSSCKYCEYKTSCNPFHKRILDGSEWFSKVAVIDEINSEFDNQNSRINITTNGGITSIHRIPKGSFVEIKNIVYSSKKVLLLDLHDVLSTNIKYWTDYSRYEEIVVNL